MPQNLEIYTFSLPGIAFGNKHVPILSLIEHPLRLKMGSVPTKSNQENGENPFAISADPIYQAQIIGERLYITINGNARDSVEVDKSFIVYRDYAPREGLIKRKIKLLDDVDTLKIVSSAVFIKVYQLITGQELENINGTFDSTRPDIVEFIISRKFTTPGVLKAWNRDSELKTYLPFRIWIDEDRE